VCCWKLEWRPGGLLTGQHRPVRGSRKEPPRAQLQLRQSRLCDINRLWLLAKLKPLPRLAGSRLVSSGGRPDRCGLCLLVWVSPRWLSPPFWWPCSGFRHWSVKRLGLRRLSWLRRWRAMRSSETVACHRLPYSWSSTLLSTPSRWRMAAASTSPISRRATSPVR